MSRRTGRSDRTTGNYRTYKGSGPVGTMPKSKPGTPGRRKRTKPLVKGKHTTSEYHNAVIRGQKKMIALLQRSAVREVRLNPITNAIRKAISGKIR